jgi:hypothetical protein
MSHQTVLYSVHPQLRSGLVSWLHFLATFCPDNLLKLQTTVVFRCMSAQYLQTIAC